MLTIEATAQQWGLRDDEWQPQGMSRLALHPARLLARSAAESSEPGPLVVLSCASHSDPNVLRLACGLARELTRSRTRGTVHAAVAERLPGTPLQNSGEPLSPALLAICEAQNRLARALDESILAGNKARLDPRRVTWPRCIADRIPHEQLRRCVTGLGGAETGYNVVPREESFITPGESELAAIAALSADEHGLAALVPRLIAGWRGGGQPVELADALSLAVMESATPALAAQPLWINEPLFTASAEGAPEVDSEVVADNVEADDTAAVAGTSDDDAWPRFEHGCSHELPFPSVAAMRSAVALGGCVAVVGGGLLGLQKFFDVVCAAAGLEPRALVLHVALPEVRQWGKGAPNPMESGALALQSRSLVMDRFGLPPLVAFVSEPPDEHEAREVAGLLEAYGVHAAPCVIAATTSGADDVAGLAAAVETSVEQIRPLMRLVAAGHSARGQLHDLVNVVYGASVELLPAVEEQLSRFETAGAAYLPVVLDPLEDDLPDALTTSGDLAYRMTVVHATSIEWRAGAGYLKIGIRRAQRGF